MMLRDAPSKVTWRFLSANNRRLCQSAEWFPDLRACRAAVQELRDRLSELEVVTMRDGPRRWAWRVRLADVDLAVSSRSYERWVEAERACALFLNQAAQVPNGLPVQVLQL